MGTNSPYPEHPKVLVLAGTTEARDLCECLVEQNVQAMASLAGRVLRPRGLGLPTRIGGFGGVDGMVRFIRENTISHVIDATHPFAAQISRNARMSCDITQTPLAVLERPPWVQTSGDNWRMVSDIAAAVDAIQDNPHRIFLGIGRQNLAAFERKPQHHYVSRVIDPPEPHPQLPSCEILLQRGPFRIRDDIALFTSRAIDLVISKNAGGAAARSKIDAARQLGLPVIMIDRPIFDDIGFPVFRPRSIKDIPEWLHHGV